MHLQDKLIECKIAANCFESELPPYVKDVAGNSAKKFSLDELRKVVSKVDSLPNKPEIASAYFFLKAANIEKNNEAKKFEKIDAAKAVEAAQKGAPNSMLAITATRRCTECFSDNPKEEIKYHALTVQQLKKHREKDLTAYQRRLIASQLVDELHGLSDVYSANNRLDDGLQAFLQAKEIIVPAGLKCTIPEADLEIALGNFYSVPGRKTFDQSKANALRASAETTYKKLLTEPSKVWPPLRAEEILGRLAVMYSLELRTADEAKMRADINRELDSRIHRTRTSWKLTTYAREMALNTLRLSELYRTMEQGRPSEREQVACNKALQALNAVCPECKNLRADLLLKLGYSSLDSQSYAKAIDYFNAAGEADQTHRDEVKWG